MNHEQVITETQRWLEKAVIGLNLCPFAQPAHVGQRIRFVVSDARHLDAFLEQLDEELVHLASASVDEIETTLLIHPTLFADFLEFNEVVGIAEEAVEEQGLEGVIQVASFHPRYQFAETEPDDITNYTNRAPYPIVHLLREDSISRAVEHYPNPERIYQRNIETLRELGHDGWDALEIGLPTRKFR